jgi:hypothetical protein
MGLVDVRTVTDALLAVHRGDDSFNVAAGGRELYEEQATLARMLPPRRLRLPTTAPIGPADIPKRHIALHLAGRVGVRTSDVEVGNIDLGEICRKIADLLLGDAILPDYLSSMGFAAHLRGSQGALRVASVLTGGGPDSEAPLQGTIDHDAMAAALAEAKRFIVAARAANGRVLPVIRDMVLGVATLDEVAGIVAIDPRLTLSKCTRMDHAAGGAVTRLPP